MQDLRAKEQVAANELAVAHEGLQASERRFRTLAAASPIGIFECDAKGGSDDRAAKILRHACASLGARPIWSRFTPVVSMRKAQVTTAPNTEVSARM